LELETKSRKKLAGERKIGLLGNFLATPRPLQMSKETMGAPCRLRCHFGLLLHFSKAALLHEHDHYDLAARHSHFAHRASPQTEAQQKSFSASH
jgi:hypothetical protein